MSAPPRVSVVIPAHNRAGTIAAAARSVLEQTWTDLELIVVDDASSDGTAAAVRALDDPRLSLLSHPENRGVSAARNTGIAAARAPWVAFQDSDDEWRPEKLARQMARLEAPGADYVAAYCGMEIETGETTGGGVRYLPGPEISPREGDILEPLLAASFVSTQTLVARRDLLDEIGGFDPALPALVDWDCVLRLARRGPVALVDAPLVRQRFSDNSITRSAEKRVRARERLVEKHLDLLAERPAILAAHRHTLAGGYRQIGRPDLARPHAAEAVRLAPANPRYRLARWRLALASVAPGSRDP